MPPTTETWAPMPVVLADPDGVPMPPAIEICAPVPVTLELPAGVPMPPWTETWAPTPVTLAATAALYDGSSVWLRRYLRLHCWLPGCGSVVDAAATAPPPASWNATRISPYSVDPLKVNEPVSVPPVEFA